MKWLEETSETLIIKADSICSLDKAGANNSGQFIIREKRNIREKRFSQDILVVDRAKQRHREAPRQEKSAPAAKY